LFFVENIHRDWRLRRGEWWKGKKWKIDHGWTRIHTDRLA
jgi:hypothetical protein